MSQAVGLRFPLLYLYHTLGEPAQSQSFKYHPSVCDSQIYISSPWPVPWILDSHICLRASLLRCLPGIMSSTNSKSHSSFILILNLSFLQYYPSQEMVTPFQLFKLKTLRAIFDSMLWASYSKQIQNPYSSPLLLLPPLCKPPSSIINSLLTSLLATSA